MQFYSLVLLYETVSRLDDEWVH